MKYEIILNDDEIEKLLNLKYNTLGEAIQELENKIDNFNLKESKKSQFMLEVAASVSGKIENNPIGLKCPNCDGRYVVRTYTGDLYYRLCNGSKAQKEQEKKKFAEKGLYSNPWTTDSEFT